MALVAGFMIQKKKSPVLHLLFLRHQRFNRLSAYSINHYETYLKNLGPNKLGVQCAFRRLGREWKRGLGTG